VREERLQEVQADAAEELPVGRTAAAVPAAGCGRELRPRPGAGHGRWGGGGDEHGTGCRGGDGGAGGGGVLPAAGGCARVGRREGAAPRGPGPKPSSPRFSAGASVASFAKASGLEAPSPFAEGWMPRRVHVIHRLVADVS